MGSCLGCSCGSEEGKGITKINLDRSCTDLPWLLLFLILWGACLAIMGTAISRGGNVNKVLKGVDYNGYICGVDEPVKDMPYVAWPFLSQYQDVVICMTNCNQTATDSRFVPFNNYVSEACMLLVYMLILY